MVLGCEDDGSAPTDTDPTETSGSTNGATPRPTGGASSASASTTGSTNATASTSSATPSTSSATSTVTEGAEDSSTTAAACDMPTDPLPDELLPRCSALTIECVEACDAKDLECADACVQADPTPPDPLTGIDCEACTLFQLLACAEPICHAENSAWACCIAEHCDDESPDDCGEAECAEAFENAIVCAAFSASDCVAQSEAGLDGCFAPEPR